MKIILPFSAQTAPDTFHTAATGSSPVGPCSLAIPIATAKRAAIFGLVIALLQIGVSGFAADVAPPVIEITAVTVTKLGGENNYQFAYSFLASDDMPSEELELEYRGAVAKGEFDAWRTYPYLGPGEPFVVILSCTEFRFEVRAFDLAGNRSVAASHRFQVSPVITSGTKKNGKVGKSLVYRIEASACDRYAASGLPKGLKLDPATGVIRGVPKKAGRYRVALSATNSTGTETLSLGMKIKD